MLQHIIIVHQDYRVLSKQITEFLKDRKRSEIIETRFNLRDGSFYCLWDDEIATNRLDVLNRRPVTVGGDVIYNANPPKNHPKDTNTYIESGCDN